MSTSLPFVPTAAARQSPALAALVLLATVGPAAAQNSVVVVPGLKIGVAGGERAAVLRQKLEPFRTRLAREIGAGVTILPYSDGLALVDALATRKVDYAVLSASAYAMAWRLCGCVEPLVAPRSLDGTTSYRSILVVKRDSPAERVEDLKGKAVSAADERSVAGRLVPFAELGRSGLEPRTHFGRIETTTGPEAAVRLLLAGKVEAAFAWSTLEGDVVAGYDRGTLRSLVDKKALSASDLRVIWRSPAIPHGPHAVHVDVMPSIKNRLREVLTHLREDDPAAYEAVEPEFGGGFATVTAGPYEALLPLVTPKATSGGSAAGTAPAPAPSAGQRPPG